MCNGDPDDQELAAMAEMQFAEDEVADLVRRVREGDTDSSQTVEQRLNRLYYFLLNMDADLNSEPGNITEHTMDLYYELRKEVLGREIPAKPSKPDDYPF